MYKTSIIILTLLLISTIWGQYELKESYYGAGGPVGATGGTYELWGSATGQTAVTTVSGGTYSDQQGFYHGEKMFYVRFFAKDVQRATESSDDSIKIWADTIKIGLHYLCRGVWRDTVIGPDDWSIYLWVDTVQAGEKNYWYDSIATFNGGASPCPTEAEACNPAFHRWARGDTAEGIVTEGTQTDAETVVVEFWEQYRCTLHVEFDPPTPGSSPYDGGKVDLVNYRQFGTSLSEDDVYEHGNTFDEWCDAGNSSYSSKLEFSDTTTAGWITLDDHIFGESGGLDKPISKTLTYKEPYNAVYANNILWRRYTLIGVPLYPREDTTRYKTFAETHGCCPAGGFDGDVDFGEQDIVLYDDMHTICSGSDSNCGTWENWYRVMRYYPSIGGYKRYQGPEGGYNPDRFTPGLGFFANQTHCDSIPIDVYGVMADTMDTFAIPLGRYVTGVTYTEYNMIANPFINPNESVDITVRWNQALIKAETGSDAGTYKSPSEAATAGWLSDRHCFVYRDGDYISLPKVAGEDHDTIFEWEGFWVLTGSTDSFSVNMRTASLVASGGLYRQTVQNDKNIFWVKLSARALGPNNEIVAKDLDNAAGYSTDPTDNAIEPPLCWYPPDNQNPLKLYFIKDGKKLSHSFYSEEQSVYTYKLKLDPGQYGENEKVLFWNLDNIPREYAVMLKIPGYDEINLRTQNEIILHNVQKPIDMELFVYPAISSVASNNGLTPGDFFLSNVVPNPFNATATINFGIPSGHGDFVSVEIVDISGHRVKTLWNKSAEAGYHTVVWDGTDDAGNIVPAGTYFCRIVHPEFRATKRAILVK